MARLASVAFTASILLGAAASFAVTKTYVAAGSSNFGDGAAWSPTGAPASTDSIVLGNAIAADSTITIDSGGVVAGTTVDTTRTYSIALTGGGPTVFAAGAVNLTAGTLAMAAGGSNTLRTSSLTIASGATLNLHSNSAIFDNDFATPNPYVTTRNALFAGRITGDITPFNRIGYADPATLFAPATSGTFAGQSVTSATGNPVLVRLTLAGDSDLNGKVEFVDLVRIAKDYDHNPGGQVWWRGDFNYDGFTDFYDLVLIAQNYNKTYTPSLSELTSIGGDGFAADWAIAQSLVPEPASLATVALGAGLLRRRRM
jgi:hypothetical protein